jgi:hypothetical protein
MQQRPPVESSSASFYAYWGKARGGWHLLPLHCLDVAAAGVTLLESAPRFRRALLTLTGLEEAELRNLAGFFCALHDLGKFSPAFQWQVPEVAQALGVAAIAQPYDVRHDSIGWVLWDQLLAKVPSSSGRRLISRTTTSRRRRNGSRRPVPSFSLRWTLRMRPVCVTRAGGLQGSSRSPTG